MENKATLKYIKDEKIHINDNTTVRGRSFQKTIRKLAQDERDKEKEVKEGVEKVITNGVKRR